uniref:Uncharacterized protein n=1 Tax=Denticeps clupeoides TaxID=299321 RepID=A0AAY4ER49_9TELE
MCKKPYCVYGTGVLCILVLVAGIVMILLQVFPNILYSQVKEVTVLKNGSQTFDIWQNPPAPVYMQYYFFNLTNPAEVLDGDKPAVVEIGPYTYREYRPMTDVEFLENGTKVAALNPKTYVFERNMSIGSEDDLIRTVNIPAATVMQKYKDSIFGSVISTIMTGEKTGLFEVHRVGDLLWGYEDRLLKALKAFEPSLDDHFGLFYMMNATDDGAYTFYSGSENYQDFTRVAEWKGQRSLNWWSTDECNMINGTIGASFHAVITKQETLYLFSSDLCRSLYARFEKEVWVKNVPGYRFVPPSEVFANVTVNPANAGFCVPAGNCLSSGLLNVSVCKQDAPIILSPPHFYQTDEKFVQDIFGMRPNKENHETRIDINPVKQTGDIRTLVFPVMYLNESVVIDDDSAEKLQAAVTQGNIVINIPFIIIGLGILLGVVFMVLISRKRIPESTPDERKPLLTS